MSGENDMQVKLANLDGRMDAYQKGQDEIKLALKEIADAMKAMIEMRANHNKHSDEIKTLRERSHEYGNELVGVKHEQKSIREMNVRIFELLDSYGKRLNDLEKSSTVNSFMSGWTFKIIVTLPSVAIVAACVKFLIGG